MRHARIKVAAIAVAMLLLCDGRGGDADKHDAEVYLAGEALSGDELHGEVRTSLTYRLGR